MAKSKLTDCGSVPIAGSTGEESSTGLANHIVFGAKFAFLVDLTGKTNPTDFAGLGRNIEAVG